MLRELYIEDLAVIKSASIPLEENFNAFTGETGAGKSILINGINAVLGQRVTKDIVRTGSEKALITALFTNLSDSVKAKLDELGISYSDDEITVTREIHADGGSIARINNRATTVSVLRELGAMLITFTVSMTTRYSWPLNVTSPFSTASAVMTVSLKITEKASVNFSSVRESLQS